MRGGVVAAAHGLQPANRAQRPALQPTAPLAIARPLQTAYSASMNKSQEVDVETRDSNGTVLGEGDNVTLINDLKVKGTSVSLARGTMVRGIHLTDDPAEV